MASTQSRRTVRRSRPRTVGIVGTFDVANFGDLLFPALALHELEQRLGPLTLRQFSYRAMTSPPWPYPVEALDELSAAARDLDLLVVGGGHLVRFDKRVAPGYEPTSSHLHHPTGYWLTPTLIAAALGIPVAWNAVGVSPETPEWGRPLLASSIDAADYVAVRDAPSLEELRRVVPAASVAQVPDSAFGIAEVLARRGPSADFANLRSRLGLDRPYVIVQPSTRLLPAQEAIRTAAAAVRASGRLVVELPISPALGDRSGLFGLGDVIAVDPWPAPLVVAEVIAGAEAVVTHSLHQTIVAISTGVPAFRLAPARGSKYEHASRFRDVHLFEPDGPDLDERLAGAARGAPAPDVLEQQAQLANHWDRVASVLLEDDDRRRERRRGVVGRLLADVPTITERLSDAAASAQHRADTADASASSATDAAGAAEVAMRHVIEERDRLAQQVAQLESKLLEVDRLLADLHRSAEEVRLELAHTQQRAAADRRLLEEEIALRDSKLIASTSAARELAIARQELKRAGAELDRIRGRRSVRAALRLAAVARRVRAFPRSVGSSAPASERAISGGPLGPTSDLRATIEQEAELVQVLASELPPSTRRSGPLVSIVMLNRDGAVHLTRLIPSLERTTYRSFELIVIDNASSDGSRELLAGAPRTFELKVIENDTNRSFSEGCNQGIELASGDLVLLLNNDIEPIAPGWLGRLVTTLEERHATAVGARLIYPRRPDDPRTASKQPDLTLQHRGITFDSGDGVPSARNMGAGDDPRSAEASSVREVPGLTAACLLVERAALEHVGGLTEGYVYGTEDVDLCLKLRAAGGILVYDGGAALWHHESGTQDAQGRDWKHDNRTANRQLFVDRWGPLLFREALVDRIHARGQWAERPLHVAITLSRDDAAAGKGDYYTGHELGEACEALGWRVSYVERYADRWYDIDADVDVLISLLDSIDLRRLPPRLVTIAWVRNWTHRWISHPWFENYDIIFASSATSQRLIEERTAKVAHLMPLATNARRFGAGKADRAMRADVLFAGNYWKQPRGIVERLHALAPGPSIAVYGRGWDETILARHHQGSLAYEDLPVAYASAGVVIDDTATHTMPYGAVNSRVFDALASGAVVITDNAEGIRDLFDDDFPVAADATELQALVDRFLADPASGRAMVDRYRRVVLEHHTYEHRARQIRDALAAWAESERYGVLIGAPDWERAPAWGDYHFARSLQRQLERRGRPTRVHVLADWGGTPTARDDVVVHLFGMSEYQPRVGQVNLMWNISHPDLLTPIAAERYDAILVASDGFAARLAPTISTPVRVLHQATDPDRFRPDPTAPTHDLLFVGSSRKVRRPIIDSLVPTELDLAIYGKHWTADMVDPRYVKGEFIPNDVLHRYYAAARIVLADHWEDMRREGFLSNRLYDALASGAFVISDAVVGIDDQFEGSVVTFSDAPDLREKIDYYLEREEVRRELAERGRAIVLSKHTFAHRAESILAEAAGFIEQRPPRIRDWLRIAAWHHRREVRRTRWRETAPADPLLDGQPVASLASLPPGH